MNQIILYNIENEKHLVILLSIIPRKDDLIDLFDEPEFTDNNEYLVVDKVILYKNNQNHPCRVLVKKVKNQDK